MSSGRTIAIAAAALAGALALPGPAGAKYKCDATSKCTNPAVVDTALATVDAGCPCGAQANSKAYKQCWKSTLKGLAKELGKDAFPKPCQKDVKKTLSNSLCGRPGYVLCRKQSKKGAVTCKVTKQEKCDEEFPPSSACGAFVTCADACNPDDCTTTSTTILPTTTLVTTTTFSTTTSTAVTTTSTLVTTTIVSTTVVTTTVPTSSTVVTTTVPSTTSTVVTTTVPTSTVVTTTVPTSTVVTTTVPTSSTVVTSTVPSTTLVTTTTTESTTTSTTLPGGTVLRFTTGPAGGNCGVAKAGGSGGAVVKNLSCGGLNIGHGSGTVPEGPTPAGADTFFNTACAAGSCTVTARTSGETGSNKNCSDTGCDFGPFLPIANPGTPALSTCVHNTFATPGNGTLDTVTGEFDGAVPLSSQTTVTGNVASPCPTCVGGTPGVAGSGTCDATWVAAGSVASPDSGNACTPTNASGDTYDCRPPQAPYSGVLAPFPVTLSPIGTGQSTLSGLTPCAGQTTNGCFGQPTCDYIEENGTPAGTLTPGPKSATLASAFCIPATGNVLVDGSAGLPGPGATSLPGTLDLQP